jgi:hypothetical protein
MDVEHPSGQPGRCIILASDRSHQFLDASYGVADIIGNQVGVREER